MKIWMGGEIDADVYDAYRVARNDVEPRVNELLARAQRCPAVRKWAHIAIIRQEDDPAYGEVAKFARRGRVAEFRLKVPHGEFRRGSPGLQRGLLLDSLIRSVWMMPETGVPDVDPAYLAGQLENLRGAHDWT